MKASIKQGLANSNVFMVLGTANYFTDTSMLEQVQYAKELKKPFRIVLEEGVVKSDWFNTEVEGYENYKEIIVAKVSNISSIDKTKFKEFLA